MAFLSLNNRITITTGDARSLGNVTMPANQTFVFSNVTGITSTENSENLVDFATIALAKGLLFTYSSISGDIKVSADILFQIGDYVKIETWYTLPQINTINPVVAQEINSSEGYKSTFTGYISDIDIGSPLVIKCENEMWALKNNNRLFPDDFLTGRKIDNKTVAANPIINSDGSTGALLGSVTAYNPKSTSLDQILKVYLYDFSLPVIGYQFTPLNVTTATIALPGYKSDDAYSLVQIFDDLKDYAGVYAFFRDGNLYIGPESWSVYQKTIVFAFRQNIIDASNLTYQLAESVKYRIEIINIKNLTQVKLKNKKPKVTVVNRSQIKDGQLDYFGDGDGAVKKLFLYNFDTTLPDAQTQLENLANAELLKYKYTGYAGSFTTFGAPVVYKGDLVKIYDPDAPSRGGENDSTYLVKSVEREFSAQNAQMRQKIYISRKV